MLINDLYTNKTPNLSEGMEDQVVFSGTGADGGKYEIIQSSPTDFMIHANGRHIDTYGSLQRAMSVLKNEVPGLQPGLAEDIGDLGYNVVRYYEKTQEVKKLTNWLEKEAGLPRNSPLYFDDVDLVYGNKTIVPGALINPKLTFNDLLTAVVQASKQGMAEATGDEKFDTMMGQIQREPKYPDSQMPPTDVKDLYDWAVENNKLYHEIFAEWANREGYKSVAPALQRAGDLDTEALDYWTPRVWKIYWGEVRGIDSEMPPEWAKKRVPDELRDYLETVFDAYNRIVFDWPTEYRQIGQQGVAEDDDAVAAFLARGGEIQRLKSAKPRKAERWQGSAHIGAAGGRGTKGRVSGLAANTGKSGKPVVTAEQGNPVAGQDFTMKDGAQMKWNPASKSWQQQAPVPGDDGGFDVVSGYDTDHTIDNGNKSTGTYTSTTIAKNPTTGQQQSLASWDHTDPKTGKNYSGTNYIDPQGNAEVQKNYEESKKTKVDEVSLGDYRKKATVNKAMAQTNKFFGRDDPAAVAAADQTIAKRERGLGRADARRRPYTAPPVDQDKQRRDLADKYPNIDELVRQAELRRDPQYDRADGPAYYDGRDAEQNYHKLKQIQRMIRGAELDEMNLGGVSQTTDSDTGDVTTNFSQGPLSVSQTKTPGGYTKQTDQQFNLGTATLGARTVGPNIGAGQLAGTTTKTATNTATGQAKQQVKGVGFGGASGVTVGKNYVGSSDDELARHAANSATGINEEPNQVTVDVPGSSFTANKSTNTLSGTTNVQGVNINATKDMTPGGATTLAANMNVTPNLNIAATQKSADYNKGQLAGTKSVAAKYTDTTGALGKPGQQHTATRTAGVGFGGATGANVGKNYVDQYSVNESMDRLRHLAGIKQSRV